MDGQNAYLVAPGDWKGLAEAMTRMAGSADLARMGALGRGMVQERFSIERTWQEYYKLFLSLGPKTWSAGSALQM